MSDGILNYQARELWFHDEKSIWALPEGPLHLTFDDGTQITTTNRETIFSWYLGVFHRFYPKTPLLKEHHLNGRQLKKSTHTDILGKALFDAYASYNEQLDLEELSKVAYETTNHMYNVFTVGLKPYVSTLSMFDVEEVMHHPEIQAANDWIKSTPPTDKNIQKCHDRIFEVLTRKGELVTNAFARMAKSRLVNPGQLLQNIGPRGFVTDTDSRIFPRPILNGYAEGIYDPHDMLIETRSAAKAHIFSADPVAQSEYFNREMQLSASVITRIIPGDCGTTDGVVWTLKEKDLGNFSGKYYFCPSNGNLKMITKDSTDIIGKPIRIRSPIKCATTDIYGLCEVCFGRLAKSIPSNTNIGHVSATVLCENVSQNVLSTKHYEGSSVVGGIDELSSRHRQFIELGDEGSNTIMLAKRLEGKHVRMLLRASEANNLAMIDNVEDIQSLAIHQITEISEVTFEVFDKQGFVIDNETLPVSHGSRLSSLTHEALNYIKENNYHPIDGRHYMVNLSRWDINQPLFKLPMKHPDMVEMMKTIKKFVMSNKKNKDSSSFKTLGEFPTVDTGLQEFRQIISSKLNIHVSHLEVIVLSTLIEGPEQVNHLPPLSKKDGVVGGYNDNMRLRSLGAAMAYQGQYIPLVTFKSYAKDLVRPDSPYDNLLEPYPNTNPRE